MELSRGLVNNINNHLYGWNYSDSVLQEIATTLGFFVKLGWRSFKYLGFPISLGNPHKPGEKFFKNLKIRSRDGDPIG